jgi:hypothetical protein
MVSGLCKKNFKKIFNHRVTRLLCAGGCRNHSPGLLRVFFSIWHTLAPFAVEMHRNDFSRDDLSFLSEIGKNAPPGPEK